MGSTQFQLDIDIALRGLARELKARKSTVPHPEDLDGWVILHTAPFELLQKYQMGLVFNEKLYAETQKIKSDDGWILRNRYYNSGINSSPEDNASTTPLTKTQSPKITSKTAITIDEIFGTIDEAIITSDSTAEELYEKLADKSIQVKKAPEVHPPASNATVLPSSSDQVMLGSGVTMGIIGEGGMARVYKIYNQELSVFRAVKVITETGTKAGDKLTERILTEAKIAAHIVHPNVVITHAVGKWQDYSYLEMEYIDGRDIARILSGIKRFPPEVACAIGIHICKGLICAHNKEYSLYGNNYKGIIHRDLKPANIMISESADVKIMDFGLARPMELGFHTQTGGFAGSIEYAAPEQFDSMEIDSRTDLYALGTMIYEMVTGIKAFSGGSIQKTLKLKLDNRYTPLTDFSIKMPGTLPKIIKKTIALDKQDRFDTAEDLCFALESTLAKITKETPDGVLKNYLLSQKSKKGRINPTRSRDVAFVKRLLSVKFPFGR